MSFNGSGSWTLPAGQPVVTGTVISSTTHNTLVSDIQSSFGTVICKDGQTTVTANLPMAGFKFTGLGAGSAAADSVTLAQAQNGFGSFLTAVAGTNTITATGTPTPTYTVGQRFTFVPANTNTGATTLNISSLGAGAVQQGGAALAGGELRASYPVTVYVTAATPVFEIISPLVISDALPIAKGSADGTKLLRVEIDGFTTATTRVATFPDKDGTVAMTSDITASAGRLLSETYYGAAGTATMTIASPCIITPQLTRVSLFVGTPVVFTTSGALPTGIVSGTTYYVSDIDNGAGTFKISATKGGADINTSGSQSGTHTLANPTYNKATNSPTSVEIEMIGGGGGGGGVAATNGATGAGGGGGGYHKFYGPATSIIAGDVTLTVGTGGTAGASGGGGAGDGGTTTATIFTGSIAMSVAGGSGGSFGAASTAVEGGAGGTAADVVGISGAFCKVNGDAGGNTVSTAAVATSYGGQGGASVLGAVIASRVGVNAAGQNGYGPSGYQANPGGGGSGATGGAAGAAGGIGAAGLIIIREYS